MFAFSGAVIVTPPTEVRNARKCEFAKHCRGEFTALGEFTLPGFSAAQLVFGLEDEVPVR